NKQVQVKVEHKSEILRKDTEIVALTSTEPETICLYCTIIELYNFCKYLKVRDSEVVVYDMNKTGATEKHDIKSLIIYKVGCIDYGIEEIQDKEQLDNATMRKGKYVVRNDGPNVVIPEKTLEFLIKFYSKSREQIFKQAWTIHFDEERTCLVTLGSFNQELLEKRAEHKAILRNVLTLAIEVLLLHQLIVANAKAVYISHNSNKHQKKTASVYFSTKAELDAAIARDIYYFNIKLEWVKAWNINKRYLTRSEEVKMTEEPIRQDETLISNTNTTERSNKKNIKIQYRFKEREIADNNKAIDEFYKLLDEIDRKWYDELDNEIFLEE
ncbi:41486_t:CDS:2, partial [Gigaspora margarita]